MAYGVLTAVKGQTTFQSDLLLHDQSPGVTDHTTSHLVSQTTRPAATPCNLTVHMYQVLFQSGTPTLLTGVNNDFPQSFQAIAGVVSSAAP